jgi:transposase
MRRKQAAPTFKTYTQAQPSLIPPSWDELVPADHLVRVVNGAVDKIDLEPLLRKYKGGGTSSYHPGMMLKVLVYAYTQRIYSSRQISKALRENVNFMWLSGGNRPDFRTINGFRGEKMKGVIEAVFTAVLELLVEEGYVKLENYFVDGTKIEANANRHKVVWAKSRAKYQERLREKVKELLKEIDAVNEAEDEVYGDKDLEEMGGGGGIDAEKLEKKIGELNQRLREQPANKKLAKAVKVMEKDYLPRQTRYEEQQRKLAGRNSYSKTDADATFMRMKEDRGAEKPWPKPAYNVQTGTENQFVVGFSIHQKAGDTDCLIPHLNQVQANLRAIERSPVISQEERAGQAPPKGEPEYLPKNMVADAGYGSEENYAYLEQHHLGNYIKYNTFHQEQHKRRREGDQFRGENFPYDPQQDEFTCPAGKQLTYQWTRRQKTDNGYLTERRVYECAECAACPLKPQCTKAKGNRRLSYSFRLQQFREQARSNLTSEDGKKVRVRRNVEVETVFGNTKHNMRFRRFMLRGVEKVKIEWGLVCIAHNIQKVARQ